MPEPQAATRNATGGTNAVTKLNDPSGKTQHDWNDRSMTKETEASTPHPPKRIRIIGLQVTPQLVIDDGDHLEPIQTQTVMVRAADIEAFPATLRQQIADEEAKFNAESQIRSQH